MNMAENMRAVMVMAGAVAVWAGLAPPARAGIPIEREITCPVGGEIFQYFTTASLSTFGSRPDGKPYGSWTFPVPLPECPSNGLVLYRDFPPEEIAQLTQLVQSPEFAALREEVPYYRAQWLATRMDADEAGLALWLLLRASWDEDNADAQQKTRYQTEFVKRAAAYPIDQANTDTLILRFRVANALRELGRFDEALVVLDTIPLDAPPPLLGNPPTDDDDNRDAREYLTVQSALLREYIARRDTSAEPARMVPENIAAYNCAIALEEGASDIDPLCSAPHMIGQVEEDRESVRAITDSIISTRLGTPAQN